MTIPNSFKVPKEFPNDVLEQYFWIIAWARVLNDEGQRVLALQLLDEWFSEHEMTLRQFVKTMSFKHI
jgi:hypothetical protein